MTVASVLLGNRQQSSAAYFRETIPLSNRREYQYASR